MKKYNNNDINTIGLDMFDEMERELDYNDSILDITKTIKFRYADELNEEW